MAQDVVMPQMGESIAEGTVTTWLKKVGEQVERDEPLFEISTDKVDAEIPSPVAGTLLEILVQPGATVPINTVVARIGASGEAAEETPKAAPEAEKADKAPAEKPAAKAAPKSEPAKPAPAKPAPAKPAAKPAAAGDESLEDRRRTKSSPVVRKIAQEHGVNISSLEGTGISGRVTKQDILSHLEGDAGESTPAAKAPSAGQPAAPPAAAPRSAAADLGPATIPEAYRPRIMEGDKVEDMSMMRSKIAEHMVMSKRISAHVGTFWEMDFSRIASLRAKHKAAWDEKFGVNLTYTSFILKVTVDALKAFPILNSSVDGQKVIYHQHVNLGIAVALDWGLIVPVIHKADEMNLLGIARRSVDLATRARTKKLKPEEVQGGTFTVTNPGIYGPMFGLPVINQPQVAIVGVGAVEKRPVVIDDAIAIRTRAYMSMSFDHRVVDGAVADQFMARIKKGIEEFDPSEL